MLKWIDYIWFVGESFHVREKSPGDGEALLMGCWYLDAALPLLTFLHRVAGGWWFYLAAVPVVLLVPFVFCRFRYTARQSTGMRFSQGSATNTRAGGCWR